MPSRFWRCPRWQVVRIRGASRWIPIRLTCVRADERELLSISPRMRMRLWEREQAREGRQQIVPGCWPQTLGQPAGCWLLSEKKGRVLRQPLNYTCRLCGQGLRVLVQYISDSTYMTGFLPSCSCPLRSYAVFVGVGLDVWMFLSPPNLQLIGMPFIILSHKQTPTHPHTATQIPQQPLQPSTHTPSTPLHSTPLHSTPTHTGR